MRVYFDNAASTPLAPEVLEAMLPYMRETYGNPSSIHSHGREARSIIEVARRSIAESLGTSPSEIFFTSGGTEADNFALRSSIETFGLKRAITSKLEHHAVLHCLQHLAQEGQVELHYVNHNSRGEIDLNHLRDLLRKDETRTLVSLMHGNNEIGNLLDLTTTGEICREFDAIFHTDTVQTVGHYELDLKNLPVDFIAASAHKFHGPKGIGFIYVNADRAIKPLIRGGAQERNLRGGTENIYGIVGMAEALRLALTHLQEDHTYIAGLKNYFAKRLEERIPGVSFNGNSALPHKSLYTVLSACLPPSKINDMIILNLDIKQISASGGSACSSGSHIGSHVLEALGASPDRATVRFSFSRYNLQEEVDYVVETLAELYQK